MLTTVEVNLGKWVLRYLFAALLDEEVQRDHIIREGLQRKDRLPVNEPMSIQMPHITVHEEQTNGSPINPRPSRGKYSSMFTPGLSIGLATPGVALSSPPSAAAGAGSPGLDNALQNSVPRTPMERSGDYFSAKPLPIATEASKVAMTPSEADDEGALSPTELDKNGAAKASAASRGKRFRISFTGKKLARAQIAEPIKPPPVEEQAEDSDSRSSKAEEKSYDDSFLGTLQQMRSEYEEQLEASDEPITSLIIPAPEQEAPLLKPPQGTTIIIQEDRPDVAGVSDLFEGSLGTLGKQADLIEKVAPAWLGNVLLRVSDKKLMEPISILI